MNKKNNKIFTFILKISIISFLILYVMMQNGYYEKTISKNITLNNENIKQFEDDVKNNRIIDIKNYKIEDSKNYSSKVSIIGSKIMDKLNAFITEVAKKFLYIFKTLF